MNIYVDLMMDSGDLVRIECPPKFEGDLHSSLDHASRRTARWNCSAHFVSFVTGWAVRPVMPIRRLEPGGWTFIGFPFRPIQICWYSEGGPIMLMVPDVERYAQEAEAEGRVVDADGLSWRMHPRHPGAREILIVEWRLMAARHAREGVADHA